MYSSPNHGVTSTSKSAKSKLPRVAEKRYLDALHESLNYSILIPNRTVPPHMNMNTTTIKIMKNIMISMIMDARILTSGPRSLVVLN